MKPGAYAFIYDDITEDRRYEKSLAEIEAKLTILDIQGRVGRMALFRSVKDLVMSMVNQGVTTIVVIGNDASLDKVLWFLPELNVALGYIPLEDSGIAKLLGIPVGVGACEVLAARRIENIDMGFIEDRYFLTELSLTSNMAAVNIEGRYNISPKDGGSIYIRNLGKASVTDHACSNVKDGLLEIIVSPKIEKQKNWYQRTQKPEETKMFFKHGEIFSKDPIEIKVDGYLINGFNFKIGIVPDKLKIITDRARKMVSLGHGLVGF